ncbi:helix-turn-helix transcriptional regulator [Pseudodesulfovibrio karagichevae]|uniref:Helix-turn-helix transcriptional regulator n=1 Tax=Pseudodesulfovibrio karagichevae TaxID=3239305 RepID=A0ABV4K0W6_9BACT
MSESISNTSIPTQEEIEAKARNLFNDETPKSESSVAKGALALGGLLMGGVVLNALLSSPEKRFTSRTAATARDIGEAIRLRRKDLGMTQKELADASGTGERFVGEIERGKETAEVGKVFDLLHALGLETRITVRG